MICFNEDYGMGNLKRISILLVSLLILSACGKSFQTIQPTDGLNQGSGDGDDDDDTDPGGGPPDPGGGTNDGTGGSGGATGVSTQSCGTRSFRINVPSTTSSNPLPVVVWFHGLGDDFQNFYSVLSATGWKSLSDQEGFILIVPASLNPNRPSFLYFNGSTFDLASTQNEMTSMHNCVLDQVGTRYNISRSKIHWIGFSEGGTFTGVAASLLSDKIKNFTLLAGAAGRRSPVQIKPLRFIVGSNDSAYSAIQSVANEWENAGHVVRRDYINGVGHSGSQLTNAVGLQNIWSWMKDN